MFCLVVFGTVCLAGSTVMTAALNKPYYDLNDADNLFKDYVKQYRKVYGPKEYLERLEIFKATLEDINERNDKFPTTVFGINRFSDYTPEEWQQNLGFKPLNGTRVKVTIPDSDVPAPSELDWRDKGIVSHVKDQAGCGSCYIFSTVGNIEGQYALKHGQCVGLSEGQTLDCLQYTTCAGGWMAPVMQELAQRAGLEREEDYPYVPAKSACKEDPSKVVARVLAGQEIHIPDEETLKQKLSEIGPLAVTLCADDLGSYIGGILHPHVCTNGPIDHAMLLVGYGQENGEDYWIIKNSWGTSWGEQGYLRLLRGVNACRMGTSYTASATVA